MIPVTAGFIHGRMKLFGHEVDEAVDVFRFVGDEFEFTDVSVGEDLSHGEILAELGL
jgi:hypothetical protein